MVCTYTDSKWINNFRFILYCKQDESEIEIIYPTDFEFKLDTNSYVEMQK
jgi:hypothetical protein